MTARRREPPPGRTAAGSAAFERWLAAGLAPDDRDRAAGTRLANAWRDRRRAHDAAGGGRVGDALRRRRWWWAPLVALAVAAVAVTALPTPVVVDEAALAAAYLDAMNALPGGGP